MAVQFVMTDAAHKYGFDNMPVDTSTAYANQSVLGSLVNTTQSWVGDYLPLGKSASVTYTTSTGFTQVMSMNATSYTTAIITQIIYTYTSTGETLISMGMNQPINFLNVGSAFENQTLYSGNDSIIGNAYNNKLNGFGGNDTIDGKSGTDTAYYDSLRNYYQVNNNSTNIIVNGPDGIDTLYNVERLKFLDKSIAYDVNGNAGQAYRLYQAAFDRKPDLGGLGVWMNQLDNGQSLEWVSTQFQNSAEFKLRYGTNVSNEQFVTLLYQNVLHRAPDTDGMTAWKGALDTNAQTPSQVLAGFSESTENKIALIGVIQNGMEYIPVI
jgi:Ca2+-binding RTX toxin-like protein